MGQKEKLEKELEKAKKEHEELLGKTDEPAPEEPEEAEIESEEEVPAVEEPAEEPPAAPQDDLTKRVADLEKKLSESEHRYSVLQGKYNAEIPRLHQQLAEARATKEETLETEELDLGDLSEDYEGAAKLKEYIRNLEGKISTLETKLDAVGGRQQMSEKDRFYAKLDEKYPDWEAKGQSPEFIEWCKGIDPLSGATRQQLLDDAQAKSDVDRVLNILNAFEPVERKESPPKEDPLKRQVVPDKKRAVVRDKNEKPQYTQAQYDAALNKIERDAKLGTIDQATASQKFKELHSAFQEGRVS